MSEEKKVYSYDDVVGSFRFAVDYSKLKDTSTVEKLTSLKLREESQKGIEYVSKKADEDTSFAEGQSSLMSGFKSFAAGVIFGSVAAVLISNLLFKLTN